MNKESFVPPAEEDTVHVWHKEAFNEGMEARSRDFDMLSQNHFDPVQNEWLHDSFNAGWAEMDMRLNLNPDLFEEHSHAISRWKIVEGLYYCRLCELWLTGKFAESKEKNHVCLTCMKDLAVLSDLERGRHE